MKKLNCILLVDDDKATNFVNKLTISKLECAENVYVCNDGEEALEFLTEKGNYLNGEYAQPNLILLDINMPRMDGWEFLDEYEKLPVSQQGDYHYDAND